MTSESSEPTQATRDEFLRLVEILNKDTPETFDDFVFKAPIKTNQYSLSAETSVRVSHAFTNESGGGLRCFVEFEEQGKREGKKSWILRRYFLLNSGEVMYHSEEFEQSSPEKIRKMLSLIVSGRVEEAMKILNDDIRDKVTRTALGIVESTKIGAHLVTNEELTQVNQHLGTLARKLGRLS